MIPDPNLSFSLTELKNDRFRDVLPSKMVIFAFFLAKNAHIHSLHVYSVSQEKLASGNKKVEKKFRPEK